MSDQELSAFLKAHVGDAPAGIHRRISAEVRATPQRRQPPRVVVELAPRGGIAVAWAAALALLLLALVAALIGAQRQPEPPPVFTYDAVFVRGVFDLEIVAVRGDGEARLGRIGPDTLDATGHSRRDDFWAGTGGYVVSPNGALAVRVGAFRTDPAWAFFDLGRLDRAPVVVAMPGYSWSIGSWGQNERFIAPASDTAPRFAAIDVRSGSSRETAGIRLPEWDAQVQLRALGSDGLAVWTPGGLSWVLPGSEGRTLDVHRTLGGRYLTPSGDRLLPACGAAYSCEGVEGERDIRFNRVGGGMDRRYEGELLPDRAIDGSLSTDGQGTWILLERMIGGAKAVLGYAAPDGAVRIVGEAALPADATLDAISGIAPDDSVIAVGATVGRNDIDERPVTILFRTDTGRPMIHEGWFAGFVPSATVDSLPGAAFGPGSGTTPLPEGPGGARLDLFEYVGPDFDDRFADPAAEELVAQTYTGTPWQPSSTPLVRTFGPFDFHSGVLVSFDCLGPTDAVVNVSGGQTFHPSCRWLGSGRHDVRELAAGENVTVTVTADPSVSWQIAIWDIPPGP